jgi:hypothetical protein
MRLDQNAKSDFSGPSVEVRALCIDPRHMIAIDPRPGIVIPVGGMATGKDGV